MRIISGSARGRRLFTPKDERVRPTSDRVKEALFSILSARIDLHGLRVLDIFAGTGNLGLEALSRGASEAVFIDNHRESISLIKKNIELLGYTDHTKVIMREASSAVKSLEGQGKFDLIFIDPPYHKGLLQQLLHDLSSSTIFDPSVIIVAESSAKEEIPSVFDPLHRFDERCYGDTCISFYTTDETKGN